MSEPFFGEVTMWGCGYAPYGWAFCNGQMMQINANQALYAVIGSQYGGDGINTFALPNLVSRAPMHWGQGTGLTSHPIAQSSGAPTIQLNANQIPAHSHTVTAAGQPGNSGTPGPTMFMALEPGTGDSIFFVQQNATVNTQLSPLALSSSGAGAAHENRQPFLEINFCIAVSGVFPTRN